jgi:hypothetical protein
MTDAIRLTLMIGQGSLRAASRRLLESLQSVEVTQSSNGPSGFQLRLAVTTDSPLCSELMLDSGGQVPPMMRVIIAVTVNGSLDVLMDGVMTHHELVPEGHGQTLSITGEDLTRVMDYADTSGKAYPGTSPETRAQMVLSNYANLGITPQVEQSGMNDTPSANEHVPRHQGKDLGYLRQLAEQLGYVFYLEPGPSIGQSIAYFGPEFRKGQTQPPLNVNFGLHTNVESMTFSFDSEAASKAQGFVQDPDDKQASAVEGGEPAGTPQLGRATLLRKVDQPRHEMAKFTPGRAAQAQKAATLRTEHGVTGTGRLNVLRYGRVLKSRRFVGARGGGQAFDGIYHVRSVTHHLARGSYLQDFTLVRNGLVSTVSTLRC